MPLTQNKWATVVDDWFIPDFISFENPVKEFDYCWQQLVSDIINCPEGLRRKRQQILLK